MRGARKPRDLAAAEEELDPQLAGFLSQDAEEKEDEETLEGCENGKEILESERGIRYRECTKYPRQPEKEHDSENTDEHSLYALNHVSVLESMSLERMLNQNPYHDNHYDGIEENDDQNWYQECTKQYPHVSNEAAEIRAREFRTI